MREGSAAFLLVSMVMFGGCGPPQTAVPALLGSGSPDPNPTELDCPVDASSGGFACADGPPGYAAPGGRTFIVDGQSPLASDGGPGTIEQPWRSISRATGPGVLRPGDAVLIRAGVYREEIHPRSGGSGASNRVTYAAYPGEEVIVTGADDARSGWTAVGGGVWRRTWTGPPLPAYSTEPVFRREMLIVDGVVMGSSGDRRALQPGEFAMVGSDTAQVAILARFPGDRSPDHFDTIEIAVRGFLFQPLGSDPYAGCGDASMPKWIRLSGLRFRHAANRAQWGAICAGSEGGLIENVRVEWTNGLGVDGSGRNHVFRGVRAENNGQMGWGASCADCLFENNASIGNNWKGYDPFWEAGGGKWNNTSGSVIRDHYAAHNDGPGIWLDGDNDSNTIENCLVVGNQVAGIMLELNTTRTLVQHNVIAATRWREWSGSGILSQAASGNAVLHNTIEANEGTGIWIRLDPLARADDGRNTILANRIVGNAANPTVEARQISIEGTSIDHVRSNRLGNNEYGHIDGDPVLRSIFFASPAQRGDLRSNDLSAWSTTVRDHHSSSSASSEPGLASVDLSGISAGAPTTRPRSHARMGAELSHVRASGDWRVAPPKAW